MSTQDRFADRRSFIKGASLAAGALVRPPQLRNESAAPAVEPAENRAAQRIESPVMLVNILQGTDSTPQLSRGNTLPIVARPFGMAHWTIQNVDNSAWMFAPRQRRIQAFRCTHQLSPWLGDYGHATFLPLCGETSLDFAARAGSYRLEDSTLSPHHMEISLRRYGIKAQLVPSERGAFVHAD